MYGASDNNIVDFSNVSLDEIEQYILVHPNVFTDVVSEDDVQNIVVYISRLIAESMKEKLNDNESSVMAELSEQCYDSYSADLFMDNNVFDDVWFMDRTKLDERLSMPSHVLHSETQYEENMEYYHLTASMESFSVFSTLGFLGACFDLVVNIFMEKTLVNNTIKTDVAHMVANLQILDRQKFHLHSPTLKNPENFDKYDFFGIFQKFLEYNNIVMFYELDSSALMSFRNTPVRYSENIAMKKILKTMGDFSSSPWKKELQEFSENLKKYLTSYEIFSNASFVPEIAALLLLQKYDTNVLEGIEKLSTIDNHAVQLVKFEGTSGSKLQTMCGFAFTDMSVLDHIDWHRRRIVEEFMLEDLNTTTGELRFQMNDENSLFLERSKNQWFEKNFTHNITNDMMNVFANVYARHYMSKNNLDADNTFIADVVKNNPDHNFVIISIMTALLQQNMMHKNFVWDDNNKNFDTFCFEIDPCTALIVHNNINNMDIGTDKLFEILEEDEKCLKYLNIVLNDIVKDVTLYNFSSEIFSNLTETVEKFHEILEHYDMVPENFMKLAQRFVQQLPTENRAQIKEIFIKYSQNVMMM